MKKKIFLLVEFKDKKDHKIKRSKVLQFCKQQGIKIKVYREFDDEKEMAGEKLFYFKTIEAHRVVKYTEIIYFKKEDRKVQIQTTKDCHYFYAKMSDIAKTFETEGFIIPHKSYIINKSKIREADKYILSLAGCDEKIPISRRYRKFVMQAFKELSNDKEQTGI